MFTTTDADFHRKAYKYREESTFVTVNTLTPNQVQEKWPTNQCHHDAGTYFIRVTDYTAQYIGDKK